ncbi:MAG: succinyl-CoA synthetase subunit beta [Planctomycetes bacterium]|nr:succinyl-CoA synthetase subunit beta [Planctomycetota bacterium]
MARLHEYQGKELLKKYGIPIPKGSPADSPQEARSVAERIGGPVVVKIQAWTTHRAALGGIQFADTPEEAEDAAQRLLGIKVGAFTVDKVLVEQRLDIEQEFYASIIIDDAARKPLLLFSTAGGTGIEERAASGEGGVSTCHIDVNRKLRDYEARNLVRGVGLTGRVQRDVASALVRLVELSIEVDARSAEINPLVVTRDGKVMAADCRLTIDDYAVYRHPELGIDIARELDHPPTKLERIAQHVEDADFRGTFYFAQLAEGFTNSERYVGFHGAGGGGSMMSMDAITDAGFKLANFTDTSGNPSAAKVYRAAIVILHQPNIVGYFGSGSGVASQEQFHSAYGLAKAFGEMGLNIPAVIRLGGNSEDRAVQILKDSAKQFDAPVEGYRKDDAPAFCAQRFGELVKSHSAGDPMMWHRFEPWPEAYSFPIKDGRVYLDHTRCDKSVNDVLTEFGGGIFEFEDGKPVLGIGEDEVADRNSELVACEVELRNRGMDVMYVSLPIRGLPQGA